MPKKLTEGEVAARIARIGDQFAVSGDFLYGEELRNGHINTTYRACYRSEDGQEDRYILQRINDYVFKDPAQVMRNVEKVTRHITWKLLRRRRDAAGQTLNLFPARGGRNYIVLPEEGGMWRCYNNIEDTHTYDVVENTRQAYQAGYAFGSFQDLICDMNPEDIKESIPDFHNTPKRYADLLKSVEADVMAACLLDAWDQTVARHLTELDTADAEHTHISLWTSSERTAVVHTACS